MTPFRDKRPVTEGEYPTGTELMLWRPRIDRSRLQERAFHAAVFSSPATCVLTGATLVAMGTLPQQANWISRVVAVLILAGYALVVWVNFWCADHDHRHGPDKPCFLDRTRGEYFYHRGDFNELPQPVVYSATMIITTVRGICASRASAWLEPQHLHEIHQVAWDVLCAVDGTRELRKLVDDPHYEAATEDLVDARARLSAVDDTLDGILDYLRQVTFLLQAWEQKLTEADLRFRLRTEIEHVPARSMAAVLCSAESLTESVFAYVTAARDVTNAGSFIWERAQP